jgi:hypothetical protein
MMRAIDNQLEDQFLNGWSLLLGVGLILAPWYFGFGPEPFAAWNARASGGTVVILAALALMQTYDWEEYAMAAAGLWACVAPWALGFEGAAATWAHVGFGVALIVSAGSELWRLRDSPAADGV